MAEVVLYCRAMAYRGEPVRSITFYLIIDGEHRTRWEFPECRGYRPEVAQRDLRQRPRG